MKTINELHLLVGLPGSGKTTFAKTFEAQTYYSRVEREGTIIDYDTIYRKCLDSRAGLVNRDRVSRYAYPFNPKSILILDGLFISQEEYEWVLSLYLDGEGKKKYKVLKVIIDYWTPDKESCIWNDRGRREWKSTFSIKAIEIDKPDIKAIEEKFGVKTTWVVHSVVRKPDYLVYMLENGVDVKEDKYLYSDTWSLGGNGHSWQGQSYTIDSESPVEFTQLDDLLEKICPNITYLQYKKVYSYSVEMKSRSCQDYYSDAQEGYYICDLDKLYSKLVELGVIQVNLDTCEEVGVS